VCRIVWIDVHFRLFDTSDSHAGNPAAVLLAAGARRIAVNRIEFGVTSNGKQAELSDVAD
jgi:hypothetical protein